MSLRYLAAALALLFLLPYVASPVYDFPPPHPFAGAQLLNPYAELRGPWRRANFHAHGRAWAGIGNGAQTDEDVAAAYRKAGYDIAEVSDYQSISVVDTVPTYEHGYNVSKRHQLLIGARSVVWWDFPFWQGVNEKQYVLDLLRPTTELISINHPSRRHSYTIDEARYLTGYNLMELANGRVTVQDRWDAALSSGRLVWGLGGDDTHDVTDRDRFAFGWTMIAAASVTPGDIIDALRRGQSYVVVRSAEAPVSARAPVPIVNVEGARMTVTLDDAAPDDEAANVPRQEPTITLIGQDGRTRSEVKGTSAEYEFAPSDTYIRARIETREADLFLNPVVRTDGGTAPAPAATVNAWLTWTRRTAILLVCALIVWWSRRSFRAARSTEGRRATL